MKPKHFKEVNTIFAKDQKEYVPLPGYLNPSEKGEFIFCMGLSFFERIKILITGRIWINLLTFNKALTPSFLTVHKSQVIYREPLINWLRVLNVFIFQWILCRFVRIQNGPTEYYAIIGWIWPFKIGDSRKYKVVFKKKSWKSTGGDSPWWEQRVSKVKSLIPAS